MIEYKLWQWTKPEHVEDYINSYLRDGWKLNGPTFMVDTPDKGVRICQAMTRDDLRDPDNTRIFRSESKEELDKDFPLIVRRTHNTTGKSQTLYYFDRSGKVLSSLPERFMGWDLKYEVFKRGDFVSLQVDRIPSSLAGFFEYKRNLIVRGDALLFVTPENHTEFAIYLPESQFEAELKNPDWKVTVLTYIH